MKAPAWMNPRELAEHGIPTEIALAEKIRHVTYRRTRLIHRGRDPFGVAYFDGLNMGLRLALAIIRAKGG